MLYDETPTEVEDWFAVCPNAVSEFEAPLPKRFFDVLRLYTNEWDRTQVAQALLGMKGSLDFAIHVLMRTYPNNFNLIVVINFTNDSNNFRSANIQADNEVSFSIFSQLFDPCI